MDLCILHVKPQLVRLHVHFEPLICNMFERQFFIDPAQIRLAESVCQILEILPSLPVIGTYMNFHENSKKIIKIRRSSELSTNFAILSLDSRSAGLSCRKAMKLDYLNLF